MILLKPLPTILFVATCFLSSSLFAAESSTIQIAKSYKDGGHYNLAGSGTPHEIRFKDERILAAGTNGTYCSGFTFTVVMRVAEQNNLLKDKTAEQIRRFLARPTGPRAGRHRLGLPAYGSW